MVGCGISMGDAVWFRFGSLVVIGLVGCLVRSLLTLARPWDATYPWSVCNSSPLNLTYPNVCTVSLTPWCLV
jgi:hypothetical protein